MATFHLFPLKQGFLSSSPFSFRIKLSLCCPASLGNRAYPIKWLTSLKKCDHITNKTKQNKTPDSPSPRSYQIPQLPNQCWNFKSPPPQHPMLGFQSGWSLDNLADAVTTVMSSMHRCLVVHGEYCFLDVTDYLWFLQSNKG